MKILAAADLHVGAGASLRSDHLGDQETVLAQIVPVAREEEVDLVLLAGDIFHRPLKALPDPERAQLVFRAFTRQLERAGIACIAVTGNASHDIRNADEACALELFESEWFRVSRVPELIKAAGDVAVCTLPSVPVHRLVARHGGGDRSSIFQEAAELLVQAARELREQVPDGWPCALVAHWSVSGANLPTGLAVSGVDEPVLPLEALEDLGFDAVVMGHIHKPQRLGTDPLTMSEGPIFYCGSPMCHDFGEASVDHGVWVIDLEADGNTPPPLFVALDDRPFVTVDVDLTAPVTSFDDAAFDSAEELDETDRIASAFTLPVEGAVIRVRYRATEEQHRRVDRQALLGFLEEAGVDRVHGPTWEPVRTTRARAEVNGDGLGDHDALDLWLQAQGVGTEEGRHGNVHALLDRFEVAGV